MANTQNLNLNLNKNDHERINECISNLLEHYFKDMENHFNGDLYHLVLSEVEQPLFEKVLQFTNYNQSKSAEILGVSRGTLRKKISQYNINMGKSD